MQAIRPEGHKQQANRSAVLEFANVAHRLIRFSRPCNIRVEAVRRLKMPVKLRAWASWICFARAAMHTAKAHFATFAAAVQYGSPCA